MALAPLIRWMHPDAALRDGSLPGPVSEEYLQARALLSSFMVRTGSKADLDKAHALFHSVTTKDPEFASGWSGLGIAELQYVRHGFGGQIHVMTARRAFDEALKLDPAATEANLYRIYMLLSRGEKESARHGIANLLAGAANDWNVHMVAGIALRGDGMYDEALLQFNRALKLNPANAAILYNHRARVYHYQNQIELAGDELEKGLALEPRHPLLRTSSGYQQMRMGNLNEAINILEGVIRDDESLRIAVPTLALCYVQVGDRARAAALLKDDTLAAAEADSEMAYRLATYFAVEGDSSEALHWLRRAIYLGNENYPWFQKNPAWNHLRTNADFERILEDLKKGVPSQPEDMEAPAGASPARCGVRCMLLEHASERDYPAIIALVNAAYRGHGAVESWNIESGIIEGTRLTDSLLREDLAAKPQAHFLITRDPNSGALLELSGSNQCTIDTWYLGLFTVDPAIQNQQLGRRLLNAAEEFARARGARLMRMGVLNVRDTLIAWYERRGYRRTGESEPFPYGDDRFGKPLRDGLVFIILEKQL